MLRARRQAPLQQARCGDGDCANRIASAAYRVLLLHLARGAGAGVSQRLLARGACACRAWCAEGGAAEHNEVLRFDDERFSLSGLAAVARALQRHAGAVRELHAAFTLCELEHYLPPDARFPRLALVRDATPLAAAVAPQLQLYASSLPRLLCRAPRLAAWFSSADDGACNLVPVVLSAVFQQALARQYDECVWRRLCCGIAGMHVAMTDMLTPERGVNACFREARWPPGVPGLLEVLASSERRVRVAHPAAATTRLREHVQQWYDGDGQSAVLATFMGVQLQRGSTEALLQAQEGAFNLPRWGTLMHKAAAQGNVNACAVLLRAGTDPLLRPADARGGGEQPSALQASAAHAAALCMYAESIDDMGVNSVAYNVLQPVALLYLATFWLLLRAAERRHGANAVARALRGTGADAATVRAVAAHAHADGAAEAEHVMPRLTLLRIASLRQAAFQRVHEAEAYVRHGDPYAAGRGFLLQLVLPHLLHICMLLALVAAAAWLAWRATVATLRLAVWTLALLLEPLSAAALRLAGRIAAAW
jgi:hypothetical protein